jgi:hypothetical protein
MGGPVPDGRAGHRPHAPGHARGLAGAALLGEPGGGVLHRRGAPHLRQLRAGGRLEDPHHPRGLPEFGEPRLHPPDARRGHPLPLRLLRLAGPRAGEPGRPAPRFLPDALRRPRGQRVRPPLLSQVPRPPGGGGTRAGPGRGAPDPVGAGHRAARGVSGSEPGDRARPARLAGAGPRAVRQGDGRALRARRPRGDAPGRPRLRGGRAPPRAVGGRLPAAPPGRGHGPGGARQRGRAPGTGTRRTIGSRACSSWRRSSTCTGAGSGSATRSPR